MNISASLINVTKEREKKYSEHNYSFAVFTFHKVKNTLINMVLLENKFYEICRSKN